MTRQQVLTEDEPVRLTALLDEAVLCRMVGGAAVLRAQLEHLVALTGRPNVKIQVLPFSAGAHASPHGPFTIYGMPAPYADVALTETNAGNIYVEIDDVADFGQKYDDLRQAALTPEESTALIRAAAERTA